MFFDLGFVTTKIINWHLLTLVGVGLALVIVFFTEIVNVGS